MEKIIGDKALFAIEFDVSDEVQFMGYAKIWLNGNFLGAPKDLIYFESYLFNLLDQFCNSKMLEDKFNHNSTLKIYEALNRFTFDKYDEQYNASMYLCSGATFTDDFYVFSYLKSNVINILWKLRDVPNFNDLKVLGDKLFHFEMDQIQFCRLTSKYKEFIRTFSIKMKG